MSFLFCSSSTPGSVTDDLNLRAAASCYIFSSILFSCSVLCCSHLRTSSSLFLLLVAVVLEEMGGAQTEDTSGVSPKKKNAFCSVNAEVWTCVTDFLNICSPSERNHLMESFYTDRVSAHLSAQWRTSLFSPAGGRVLWRHMNLNRRNLNPAALNLRDSGFIQVTFITDSTEKQAQTRRQTLTVRNFLWPRGEFSVQVINAEHLDRK